MKLSRYILKTKQGGIVLICCLITILLSSFTAISLALTSYASQNIDNISQVSADFQRYSIRDNLLDDQKFQAFKQVKENINSLASFYNQLADSQKLTLLSIFHQPLYISDFKGSSDFLYGSSDFQESNKGYPTAVNAIQINKQAFDFYHLKVENNNHLDWEKIDYQTSPIPILLGSDYKNIYKIGDTFVSDFYSKNIRFQVAGFLEKNTYIYYQDNPEFYLDKYMVVPYPLKLPQVSSNSFQFESILYFAMINSDIVSKDSQRELVSEIKEIANTSHFSDFSLTNIDDVFWKYESLLSIIRSNTSLLYILIGILLFLSSLILYGILYLWAKMKLPYYSILRELGYLSYKKDLGRIIGFLAVLSLISHCLPIILYKTIFTLPFYQFLLIEIPIFITLYGLLTKKIKQLLRGV